MKVIRTVGIAAVGERITFATKDLILVGECVMIQTTKPHNAEPYGSAKVISEDGFNEKSGHWHYTAVRTA